MNNSRGVHVVVIPLLVLLECAEEERVSFLEEHGCPDFCFCFLLEMEEVFWVGVVVDEFVIEYFSEVVAEWMW